MSDISVLIMNRFKKTEFTIYVSSLLCCITCFQKKLTTWNLASSLKLVLCHVAAVKSLSVHHHSADYIFSGNLGSLSSARVILKCNVVLTLVPERAGEGRGGGWLVSHN